MKHNMSESRVIDSEVSHPNTWIRKQAQTIREKARENCWALLLTLLIVTGVAARLYVASILSIDADEGQFIYQAQRSLHGALPIRDLIPEPDPLYIWLLALTEIFLGPTLSAARLLSVAFSAAAILFTYLLASELSTKWVAFLASATYALSPTIVLYNSIGNYRQVAWPMVIMALYYLSMGLRTMNWRPLSVFGGMVGLATLTYRVTGAFLLTAPILLLVKERRNLRKFPRLVAAAVGGGLCTILPLFMTIVSLSNLDWVNRVWGFGGGIGSGSRFAVQASSDLITQFDFLSRISFVVVREWFYLIFPSIIGLALALRRRTTWLPARGWLFPLAIITLTGVLSRGQFLPPNPDYGAYPVWPLFDYLTVLFSWLGIAAVFSFVKVTRLDVGGKTVTMLVYWILTLVAVSLLFRYFHVFYFVMYAAPLSLLSSFGFVALYHGIRNLSPGRLEQRVVSAILISIVLVSAIIAGITMYTTPITERDVTQAQAAAIGRYVASHTTANDEILTGNLIYSVYSGRNNELNVSNPWIYLEPQDEPFPGNPFGSTPSVSQLASHIMTGQTKYVIMDRQLIQILLLHPMLQDAITAHFSLETTIFGIELHRFSG